MILEVNLMNDYDVMKLIDTGDRVVILEEVIDVDEGFAD